VLKLFSEAYIFGVVFVINCSWRKRYFFYFWKPDLTDLTMVLMWQKQNDGIPGLYTWLHVKHFHIFQFTFYLVHLIS